MYYYVILNIKGTGMVYIDRYVYSIIMLLCNIKYKRYRLGKAWSLKSKHLSINPFLTNQIIHKYIHKEIDRLIDG